MIVNNLLTELKVPIKLPILLILGLLFGSCQEKHWYEKIEKFSPQELESFDLGEDADVAYRSDIISIQTPLNDYPKSAFKALLNTNEFADCCGPEPKMPVLYYHVLMNQKDRKNIFLEMLERANRPGKIYALIALSEIDYDLFVQKIQSHLNDSTTIEMYITDVGDRRNFNRLLVSDWSVKNLIKGEAVIDWLKKNPVDSRDSLNTNYFDHYDVINEGWKNNFNYINDWPELNTKMDL